jgi:hypothetical protein
MYIGSNARRHLSTPYDEGGLPRGEATFGMEHEWSQAGATSGNQSQIEGPRKRLKQADSQPVATHGNRFAAHGKEGVDGSSPSEGSSKSAAYGAYSFRSTCSAWNVQCVCSRGRANSQRGKDYDAAASSDEARRVYADAPTDRQKASEGSR